MGDDSLNSGVLSTLQFYDDVRLNLTSSGVYDLNRTETSKVDWLERVQGSGEPTGNEHDAFAICHLASFTSLTLGNSYPSITGYEELVGMALAAHHLNTGDGSIVSEVRDLHLRCPVRFTTEFMDNELDRKVAVGNVLEYMGRSPTSFEKRRPCAFVGARASSLTLPTAMLTGLNDYVQIAASATAPSLDDPNEFPLFARTIPSDVGKAVALIRYLYEELNIRHLAVINVNDVYGNQMADAIRLAVKEHANDEIIINQIPLDEESEAIPQVIASLKRTQYRYIFAVLHNPEDHDALLTEAVRQGVAGNGLYNWFFDDPFLGVLEDRAFEKGSDLHLAYHGAGQVTLVAFTPSSERKPADIFLERLGELNNPTDVAYLNDLFPHEQHNGNPLFESIIQPVKNGDFLSAMAEPTVQSRSEGLYYDAVIALGLAACDAFSKLGMAFTGKDHFDSMVNNIFEGVTGTIRFDPITGSRDPTTSNFQTINYVERDVNDTHVEFEVIITDQFAYGKWTEVSDFTFNNGGSDVPLDIPPVELEENVTSTAVRATVLALCAVTIGLSVLFALWTHTNRHTHVVRASQPFFLYSISIGVLILASSIIPLSFDHGVASDHGSTIACNSTIWLVSLGFCVTFSALFTKNYRINMILGHTAKLRRVKVSVRDVIIPMFCLLTTNTVILAVMTVLAPVEYQTEILSVDDFDRPSEILSQCSYDGGQGPYLAALSVINVGCLLYAIFQAYQARHLTTEFGESRYVFKALLSTLLVGMIGVPVLLLARDNNNASTFVGSAILFVASTSILLVMFVPKIRYLNQSGDKEDRFRRALAKVALKAAQVQGQATSSGGNEEIDSSTLSFQQFAGSSQISRFGTNEEASIGMANAGAVSDNDSGIQVYGAQTKEELVLQNETLKNENARLRRRLTFLLTPGDNGGVMNTSGTPTTTMSQLECNDSSRKNLSSVVEEENDEAEAVGQESAVGNVAGGRPPWEQSEADSSVSIMDA